MAIRGEESCVHEWFLKRSPMLKLYLEVFMDFSLCTSRKKSLRGKLTMSPRDIFWRFIPSTQELKGAACMPNFTGRTDGHDHSSTLHQSSVEDRRTNCRESTKKGIMGNLFLPEDSGG